MFGKRKDQGMDPQSAHMIGFALEVSQDEIAYLIEIADGQGRASLSDRLARHRTALAQIRSGFSAQSDNLQELADQTDAIASEIAEIERLLDICPDDAAFHCILAAGYFNTESGIARGE